MIPDEDSLKWLWLMFVALFGAVLGFLTKKLPKLNNRSILTLIKHFILCIGNSMLVSYIVYEISTYIFENNGLSVGLAGYAAFLGTDLLIIAETKLGEIANTIIKFRK